MARRSSRQLVEDAVYMALVGTLVWKYVDERTNGAMSYQIRNWWLLQREKLRRERDVTRWAGHAIWEAMQIVETDVIPTEQEGDKP